MLESWVEKTIRIENKRFIAAKHLEPGITLFVEPPLASVPLPSKRHQRCNYCLRKAQLQCCSRCKSAYFCSNECFRNAWFHFHRILCEPQEADIYINVDADRWLLERTALTLHSHDRLSKQQQSHSHFSAAIKALQELDTPNISLQSNPVDDVAQSLKPSDCQLSSDELNSLWHRLQSCTFPIIDYEHYMDYVAVGVYPITALYTQHSCRPNAALIYKLGKQCLVTIEPVQPGEPITIAYVDLISTKQDRWKQLKNKFGQDFECHCIRCEGSLAGFDVGLERGQSLITSEEEGMELISQHIKTWSVLNMFRRAEQTDNDNWTSIQVMDPPQFTHFIYRLAFPEIYYATTGDKRRHHATHFTKCMSRDHLIHRLIATISALLSVPQVPPFAPSTIHGAEKVLVERLKAGKWVEASRCSLFLFVAYSLLYPPLHPKVAYHSLILAKSCWNALIEMELIGVERKLEKIYANGTGVWIEWAKVAVNSTFGKELSLWRELVELQWVFNREQQVKFST